MNIALKELVLETSNENPDVTSPVELAQLVAQATPEDKRDEFYQAALVPLIRDVLGKESNAALADAVDNPKPKSAKAKAAAAKKTAGKKGKKAPVVSTFWSRLLVSRVATSEGWKVLRDCGEEDLQYAITQREKHIERVQANITRWQKLIDAMHEQGVDTVGELEELAEEELAA